MKAQNKTVFIICLQILLVLFLFTSSNQAIAKNTPAKVWIDADPACDNKLSNDVDDCWALIYALFHKELQVTGISTVFGNMDGQTSFEIGERLLQKVSQVNIKTNYVYKPGANSPLKKSRLSNQAVEAIHEKLHSESLTIIALGPLTNIALLLHHYPEDKHLIKQIVAVAGQRDPHQMRFSPTSTGLLHMHDLNFRKDVVAFQEILDSGVPLTLIPFELAAQLTINESDLGQLSSNSWVISWLVTQSKNWLTFWQQAFDLNGFYPFDLLAVSFMTNPDLYHCELADLEIIQRRSLFVNSRSTLLAKLGNNSSSEYQYCYKLIQGIKPKIMAELQRM